MVLGQVLVAVPVSAGQSIVRPAPNLDESNTPFQQSPRDEAALAEILGHFFVQAIKSLRRGRLAGNVQDLRSAQLEFCRKFIGRNPGIQARIARARPSMSLV